MKPIADHFAVVTATTNRERSRRCRWSWEAQAARAFQVYTVDNGSDGSGRPYLGTVPAFAEGVRRALDAGHEIICCFHDDLEIQEPEWDLYVLEHFRARPQVGLVGFLGGKGLGAADIYRTPYDPMQLARQEVVSNEQNAEAHGQRWRFAERVAVLDGFSQIGRREFWKGKPVGRGPLHDLQTLTPGVRSGNLFAEMAGWGLRHHAYDAALGCFAARLGWEVWMLPIACHHQGGQTAVGDQGYQAWAKTQAPGGDQEFWERAHKEVYERFRDVLPIRVP